MLGEGWEPPAEAAGSEDFRWFHISGTKPLIAVVTCTMPLWYTGHYHRGRMCPCTGEHCEMCEIGVGSQVRFVFSLADCSQRAHGLLETGRTVAQEVRDLAARIGGLRGLMLEISKHSLSRKSRMEVINVPGDPGTWFEKLPPIDIEQALRATWSKAEMKVPDGTKNAELSSKRNRVKARVSSSLEEGSRRVR